jgi:hypothetical protein
LERAQTLAELLLETEPEWRLCEALAAAGIPYTVTAGQVGPVDPTEPAGGTWVEVADARVRYEGANGFRVQSPLGGDRLFGRVEGVLDFLAVDQLGGGGT